LLSFVVVDDDDGELLVYCQNGSQQESSTIKHLDTKQKDANGGSEHISLTTAVPISDVPSRSSGKRQLPDDPV
jgi:hypothetical protein